MNTATIIVRDELLSSVESQVQAWRQSLKIKQAIAFDARFSYDKDTELWCHAIVCDYELPKLGKTEVDDVTILDHGGREYSFRVLVNPSRQRMLGLLNRSLYHAIRVMINPKDGTVYAWAAEHAIHADVTDYYGIKVQYEKGWSYEFVGDNLCDIDYAYEQFLRDLRQGFPEAPLLGGIYAARDGGTVTGGIAKAEQLESEGKSRQAIWQATGWVRGPGGQWRFEIDDSKAKLKKPGKARSQKATEEEKGWRWHSTRPPLPGGTPATATQAQIRQFFAAYHFVSNVKLSDVLKSNATDRLPPDPGMPAGSSSRGR